MESPSTFVKGLLLFAALAALGTGPSAAQGDAYPTRPVRVIVGFQPGGPTDIFARVLARGLTVQLQQPFVVENRPGADANIAMGAVAKAPPDGHTLYLMQGGVAVNPAIYSTVPFDPIKDFAPITLIGAVPNLIGVHPSLPVTNMREFIAYAKEKKGQLFYGATGGASMLDTELLKSMAGIQMDRVNYKGSAPALLGLSGGEVQFLITSIGALLPLAQAGKVRALAVTSARRSSLAPEIPTVEESGLPGYVGAVWYGVAAPGGTPRPIIDKLNAAIRDQLADPDVRAQFAKQGIPEPSPTTPEQFSELIRSDLAKWRKVAKEANIRVD